VVRTSSADEVEDHRKKHCRRERYNGVMGHVLSYPPTPPRDRVGVVWEGDEVDITLPPRMTARTFAGLLILAAVAVVCFACALRPDATASFAESSIRFTDEVLGRASAAIMGAAAVIGLAGVIRGARTWTRLAVHGGELVCTVPTLAGTRLSRYPFAEVIDATVGQPEDHGGEWWLFLHRRGGRSCSLLENTVYRLEDLRQVAAILRDAIRRSHPRSDATTPPPNPDQPGRGMIAFVPPPPFSPPASAVTPPSAPAATGP
jgi:hypothetical protein